MPVFLAVQCFQCSQAQVAQQRKDSRFVCKLCAAKQSVRKVLARSSRAADVRPFVQRFNLQRGLAAERYDHHIHPTQARSPPASPPPPELSPPEHSPQLKQPAPSRWRIYSALVASRKERSPSPECQPNPDSEQFPVPDHLFVTVLPDATAARRQKASSRKRHRQNAYPNVDNTQPASTHPPTRRRRINLPDASPPKSPAPAHSFDSNHCTVLPGDEPYHEQTWP
ncbi:MRN complex-interacting protein [Gracilariopsis chorda]|uniref:MRN complex-interacting protein n=1 Tax=Gracilariopsis chorda TaxID=448386 RepID=A0A2V3IIN8_9FLOR|nr:MRN complex-interacting protein [Gracilariopsis chorda]|eukprot:PXF41929.1 MRN complex-interacting protein [Gracilariopsis chorda]